MVYSKKILSAALAVAMIAMLTPTGSASETVTQNYLSPGGASLLGESVGTVVNPPSSFAPLTPPGWLLPPGWVGGAHLHTTTFYNSVVISVSDDIFGSEAATAACFWAFGGDDICDANQDMPSEAHCGPHVLVAPGVWRGAEATAWTFAILVDEDLVVCGATQGTVTGQFFNA